LGQKWEIAMDFNKLELFIGLILVFLGEFLAIVHSNFQFHFVLVLGILLVVQGIYNQLIKPINTRQFLKLYFWFFLIGVVVETLGLLLQLWYYSNYTVLNAIIIYLFTYPAVEFGLVYTFLILEHLFFKEKIKASIYPSPLVSIFVLFSAVILLCVALIFNYYNYFFLFCSIMLFFISIIDLVILKTKDYSYLTEVFDNSLIYVLIFLLTAATQGIIQEFPNTFVYFWAYTNNPVQNITLLNIPIIVLIGWTLLIFVPHMIYRIMNIENSFSKKK